MALFGEITARAVSSGTTTASLLQKRVANSDVAKKKDVTDPWGGRTFDLARNEKRQERMQRALQIYNFTLDA